MSIRDSRGRDFKPQTSRAADEPDGSPLPPNLESLPPQPPVVPQVPQPTGGPTAAAGSQSPTPLVLPPYLAESGSPAVIPDAGAVQANVGSGQSPNLRMIPDAGAAQANGRSGQSPNLRPDAGAGAVQADDDAGLDEEELDLRQTIGLWQEKIVEFFAQRAVPNAPPWLVSMLIHLVIVLVLALIALPQIVDSTFVVEVSYAEELGEQLLDDTQFLDAIEVLEVDPALAFDAREVENPLASSAPPQIKMELFEAASELETPAIGLALSGREPGAKRAMLAAYGGTGETENAVELALEWLKRNQQRDGTWMLNGPYENGILGTGPAAENRVAATAMALLAFQGAGNTHQSGDYKANVKQGMDALLKMQDREGSFFATQRIQSNHQLYSQAQATIAVCELYGMTEDASLRDHAQRALDYAGSIQADDGHGGGGWKYQPGTRADTSVTGWFVIALKSGEMGRLSVPSPVKDRISRFLDNVAAVPREGEQFVHGSRYLYQVGDKEPRVSMTAEALLCRQYLGWAHDDPRLLAGVRHVGEHPIDWDKPHVYYWYYATQVMHHIGGDAWDDWNDVMRKKLPAAQVKTGRERGSWSPAGDQFGNTGGRLFMTCLCTYMLEVYYRHLPIYQH